MCACIETQVEADAGAVRRITSSVATVALNSVATSASQPTSHSEPSDLRLMLTGRLLRRDSAHTGRTRSAQTTTQRSHLHCTTGGRRGCEGKKPAVSAVRRRELQQHTNMTRTNCAGVLRSSQQHCPSVHLSSTTQQALCCAMLSYSQRRSRTPFS